MRPAPAAGRPGQGPGPRLAAALVASLALASVAAPARAGDDDRPCARRIDVVGRASESLAPDFAEAALGVEARGASPAAALDAASKAVSGLAALARDLGAAPEDVGTAAVTLHAATRPVQRPGGATAEEPDGYRATNTVTVRLADMGRLGDLLRRALDAGANRIDGVGFGLRDPEGAQARLQVAAARDARARAEALAGALGAGLGPLCSLSAGGGSAAPMARALAAAPAKGRPVPVEAGTIPLSAEVSAAFAVAP